VIKETQLPYLIVLGVLLAILVLLAQYWYIVLAIGAVVALAIYVPKLVRRIQKNRYFASEAFLAHKAAIASVVAEHNEVSAYVSEIRQKGSFEIGASTTGSQAHLATFQNTSKYGYRRDRNVAQYGASNVHNCSLQVVRNAAADPLKYVMKYFDIKSTDEDLADVERVGESVSRLENAVENVKRRETGIVSSINPPAFILKYYSGEFMSQLGVNLSPVAVPYPEYAFEYVSAGGNSSQRTSVKLDSPTIDALIGVMSQKIRFSKTAAGQRALMTAKVRTFVKDRDRHTCQSCSVSVAQEPNLLLEVDHIMPLSRGGLSALDNLQTLCWRCNRSKSNKIIAN
jgi:hypothetical protein